MVTRRIVVFVVAGVLGIGAGIYFFPSEKKRIRRQFATLSAWAAKEGEESQLVIGRKIQQLRSILADSIRVDAPAYDTAGTYNADDIAQRATIGRSQYSTLSLRFFDMEIEILDAYTARVLTTARLTGTSREGEHIQETHEVDCTLQKLEGTWVFTACEVVDVLQK